MTLRKLTLATVATIALTSSAFAADQSMAMGSQWGVGAAYMLATGMSQPAAQVTYLNNQFIVQGSLGYQSISGTEYSRHGSASISSHGYDTSAAFGLRNMMNNQVSLDYGIGGSYTFLSNTDANLKDPYGVGVFVGVDFTPVQNILFTAGISPYTYSRTADSLKRSYLFTSGSVGVAYMF